MSESSGITQSERTFPVSSFPPQAIALPFFRMSAWRAWQCVVLFSLLIRLLVLLLVRGAPVASDAGDYIYVARQILSGHPFVPYWPPGVPLLLVPFVYAGASETILRVLMLAVWVLCCWGLYRLMEAFDVAGVAWLALLVFSLLPDAVQMSLEPMTQMPTAALMVLALGSAVRLLRGWNTTRESILLGFSMGLLCLVRPSTGLLVLFLPISVALLTKHFKAPLISLLMASLLIASWVQHAHAMTGRWLINTANSVNLFYGNNQWTPNYRTWYFGSHAKEGSEEIKAYPGYAEELEQVLAIAVLDRPAAFQKLAFGYVQAHPIQFLMRTANRIRAFLGFDTFTSAALSGKSWLGIPLVMPGLALEALIYLLLVGPSTFVLASAASAFWRNGPILVGAGAIVLYSFPYWLTMSHPTYHFPVLLPLVVLGTVAWARNPREVQRTRGWIAVGILLLIQVEWIWQASQSMRHGGG